MLKIVFFSCIIFLFSSCFKPSSSSSSNSSIFDNSASELASNTYYNTQWYINKDSLFYKKYNINENSSINAKDLLIKYSGVGIKIAIIDDGLDANHEDLQSAIINSFNTLDKSSNVSHTFTSDSHGTGVAGIIAARNNNIGISGIAYNSKIIFLKYKDEMSDSETIELFSKAEEFGADIINCSWGTYDVSQAVKDKIIDLSKNGRGGKGTIIVFASGNDNQDILNDESNIKEVISVGASNIKNLRSSFSNFGENLDIIAPGGYQAISSSEINLGISTLDPMYFNGVNGSNYTIANKRDSFIGTSASAPIVSAVIALMLEKNPNLTRDDVENILKSTSDKIGKYHYINNHNKYYGYGKINLFNIMEKL